jgi:hypothetical protein
MDEETDKCKMEDFLFKLITTSFILSQKSSINSIVHTFTSPLQKYYFEPFSTPTPPHPTPPPPLSQQ